MSTTAPLAPEDIAFLTPYLPTTSPPPDRPFVTLTYAQSLDSRISLGPGLRTSLSGPETKSLTHFLRMHHDAILVGVGTAVADDPSLNCRYPGAEAGGLRPVVLDPRGRWDVSQSKVRGLVERGEGRGVWVLREGEESGGESVDGSGEGWESVFVRAEREEGSGVWRLRWSVILRTLRERGLRSVMVEGGATVITELLKEPELVDSVIVTIAPTWLGREGVVVSPPMVRTEGGERVNAADLVGEVGWRQFGRDAVVCGRLR